MIRYYLFLFTTVNISRRCWLTPFSKGVKYNKDPQTEDVLFHTTKNYLFLSSTHLRRWGRYSLKIVQFCSYAKQTRGAEIPRFAVFIDLLMLRFSVCIDLMVHWYFKKLFSNCWLNRSIQTENHWISQPIVKRDHKL